MWNVWNMKLMCVVWRWVSVVLLSWFSFWFLIVMVLVLVWLRLVRMLSKVDLLILFLLMIVMSWLGERVRLRLVNSW